MPESSEYDASRAQELCQLLGDGARSRACAVEPSALRAPRARPRSPARARARRGRGRGAGAAPVKSRTFATRGLSKIGAAIFGKRRLLREECFALWRRPCLPPRFPLAACSAGPPLAQTKFKNVSYHARLLFLKTGRRRGYLYNGPPAEKWLRQTAENCVSDALTFKVSVQSSCQRKDGGKVMSTSVWSTDKYPGCVLSASWQLK